MKPIQGIHHEINSEVRNARLYGNNPIAIKKEEVNELEQERLRYENMQFSRKMWYSEYTGQSVGKIIHFLYVYGGLNASDYCQIGNGEIIYYGKRVGVYHWEKIGDLDIPIFSFDKNSSWKDWIPEMEKNQTIYLKYFRAEQK